MRVRFGIGGVWSPNWHRYEGTIKAGDIVALDGTESLVVRVVHLPDLNRCDVELGENATLRDLWAGQS
jgi:hypothetical protein